MRVDMEPLPDVPFHTDLKLFSVPGLTTISGTVGGTRHRHTRSLIADGNDNIALMMALAAPR